MATEMNPTRILDLGLGFFASKVLLSAVELGLFTELAKGPLDAETLRTRLKLHPRSVPDFFDTLVALKMLNREGNVYSNTPDCNYYLDEAKETYVGGWLKMVNSRLYGFWGHLTEGLKTGQPQNEARDGGNFWKSLHSDPVLLEQFMTAMTGVSLPSIEALLQKFPWQRHQSFVDVGSAQGAMAVRLVKAFPHLRGGGFDFPVVKPIFDKYVKAQGMAERLEFHTGDFLSEQPLPKADVLIMGHILHGRTLEQKRYIIKKAWEALPKGGALLVYDAIIDDERRENVFGLLSSLNMLIENGTGYDYTAADCIGWMREAGFSSTHFEHLVGHESMIVGTR